MFILGGPTIILGLWYSAWDEAPKEHGGVALLRFLRAAVVLVLILLMLELVFGVLLVEVDAMFD